jgi:hypothetical protein
MNFRSFFSFAAVSVSLALVACAAPTSTDGSEEPAEGSDEALSAGHKMNTTVAAHCNSAVILNGFAVPSQMWSADISESLPAILNGFPVPTFSVTVKQGDTVQATLDNCTGNLDKWNLHCTVAHQALGVSNIFDLSDKASGGEAGKGVFQHSVVAPGAPIQSHPFFCERAKAE